MTTSLKYPSVLAESGAGNAWQNLQNAASTPGAATATLLLDGAAKQVDITAASLAFAIPAGATINGITATVYSIAGEINTYDLGVTMKKSGTTTETKTQTGLADSIPVAYGTATDKWSTNWTANDINANISLHLNFTLGVGAIAFFTFDGVGVTVYYTVNGVRGRQFRERGAR